MITELKQLFPVTTFVRRAMAHHVSTMIFTNTYKKCWTVKCYTPFEAAKCQRLVDDVHMVMSKIGHTDYTLKVSKEGSLIVRIPK